MARLTPGRDLSCVRGAGFQGYGDMDLCLPILMDWGKGCGFGAIDVLYVDVW